MADKRVILPENQDDLIEKWAPVIEGTGKWEKIVDGMPKVDAADQGLLATQLEILEQTELKEATVSGNVQTYSPVLIPMVRRVMPALIGGKLFGTQPMTGPSGLIFSLKSLYQGDGTEAFDQIYEMLFLDTAVALFENKGQAISGDVSGTGTIMHGEGKYVLIKVASGTFLTSADVDDAGTYSASVAGVDRAYEKPEALADVIFKNFSGSMDTATGETLGTATKELGFEIGKSTVEAKTRKLKTRWTIELEDDLRSVHGMNAEQLLSGFCGDEIVREMNREFVDNVHDYAALTTDDGFSTGTWTYSATAGVQGRTENERYQALANFISRAARRLAKSNLRGQATFMIITLPVLTALEGSGQMKSNGNTDPLKNPFVGTFQGMEVYVDMFPIESGEYCLLGYKGDEIDAGFYYCPYIPLRVNKGYGEEDNIPRLFFSTRYGLGENPFGAKNYYHKIIVDLSAIV